VTVIMAFFMTMVPVFPINAGHEFTPWMAGLPVPPPAESSIGLGTSTVSSDFALNGGPCDRVAVVADGDLSVDRRADGVSTHRRCRAVSHSVGYLIKYG
jgi:hypothetical protein